MADDGSPQTGAGVERRLQYAQTMLAVRNIFEGSPQRLEAGTDAVRGRSDAVDTLIGSLWQDAVRSSQALSTGVALLAVGGYGRRELFPFSDVDLLFLLDVKSLEASLKDPIRALNQSLWDSGLRVSTMTRTLAECERFNPENVEFTLSLLDARALTGDAALSSRLIDSVVPRLIGRDARKIVARLIEVTRTRHARYGNTLFHLEPNVKDCPGGLRDAHGLAWLTRLGGAATQTAIPVPGFAEAREFLLLIRTFLHLRHERDDNLLDWHVQDEAAAVSLGVPAQDAPEQGAGPAPDAAYWMRLYFRHARIVERTAAQALEAAASDKPLSRLPGMSALRRLGSTPAQAGFELSRGRIVLTEAKPSASDPACNPEVMLGIFASVAQTGARLSRETERRLEGALPRLSDHLEDGPGLWRHLQRILSGPHAGLALRGMHALGILELLVPEFHGIDALVIRDAYHRYTVDEHTFVLLDTLHGLASVALARNPTGLEIWASRFATLLRDLPHPGLLYLAALLHDTGKGHTSTSHAAASARLARSVTGRLELEPYEAGLVLGLIENHLEMSAALRRDVFDAETVRAFAARVPTPEALRMLTLFTYADIVAVHPDALTPWKAENLWRLHIATANYLDRNVDDDRLSTAGYAPGESQPGELLHRAAALVPGRSEELGRFLEGLPQRYLLTRTPEQVRAHLEMALRLEAPSDTPQPRVELDFRYAPEFSELTLISSDRPMLFADMAGALAAWGMNIVTADAFSNAHGLVVDSFRFTDTFRTLEMNESERERFVASIRQAITGAIPAESMLAARRRGRRRTPKVQIESRLDLDNAASSHSTLLQVVAQDTPGLLRALSLTMAAQGCNIEVALVDTEGEMAIDVFYITRAGQKLSPQQEATLRRTLLEAMEANAR